MSSSETSNNELDQADGLASALAAMEERWKNASKDERIVELEKRMRAADIASGQFAGQNVVLGEF